MMKLDVFQENLSLYGADLSRWPVADIKSALALIEASPEAARAFGAAEKLDYALRLYTTAAPAPLTDLAARIVRQTRHVPQEKLQARWFFENLYLSGGSLFLLALLGFMLSFSGETPHAFASETTLVLDSPHAIIQDINDDLRY
jgi:hypothetical protein